MRRRLLYTEKRKPQVLNQEGISQRTYHPEQLMKGRIMTAEDSTIPIFDLCGSLEATLQRSEVQKGMVRLVLQSPIA